MTTKDHNFNISLYSDRRYTFVSCNQSPYLAFLLLRPPEHNHPYPKREQHGSVRLSTAELVILGLLAQSSSRHPSPEPSGQPTCLSAKTWQFGYIISQGSFSDPSILLSVYTDTCVALHISRSLDSYMKDACALLSFQSDAKGSTTYMLIIIGNFKSHSTASVSSLVNWDDWSKLDSFHPEHLRSSSD